MKFQEFEAINAKLKNGGIILLLVQLIKIQITVKYVVWVYVRCCKYWTMNGMCLSVSLLHSFAWPLIENDVTGNLRAIVAVIVSRFIYCTFKIESATLSIVCTHGRHVQRTKCNIPILLLFIISFPNCAHASDDHCVTAHKMTNLGRCMPALLLMLIEYVHHFRWQSFYLHTHIHFDRYLNRS